QREQPSGKDRIFAPLAERAVGTKKSFLRHLFGAAAIVTKTIRQVNQWPLPAPDNPLKGGNVARQHSFNIGLIVARAHPGLCLIRYDTIPLQPVAFIFVQFRPSSANKSATATGPERSYRTKAEELQGADNDIRFRQQRVRRRKRGDTRRGKYCPVLILGRRVMVRCPPQRERNLLQERNPEKNRG